MKVKTPEHYCKAYLAAVYEGELDKAQTIEVCSAFHAGIEATCKFIEEYMTDDGTDHDLLVRRMVNFRQKNKDCALHINLLRFGES